MCLNGGKIKTGFVKQVKHKKKKGMSFLGLNTKKS